MAIVNQNTEDQKTAVNLNGTTQPKTDVDRAVVALRAKKERYETIEVTTKDDDFILGVRVRENKNEMVLKDVTRNEIVIPTSAIKEKKSKTVSLMPAGLANALTHSELIDLVRFMSELGKPGDYANDPKPVVRKWQVLGDVMPEVALERNSKIPWTPAFSFVSGILPLESLPTKNNLALAQFEIQMTTPGKIRLKFNSLDGLKMWVNATSTEMKANPVLDLTAGSHRITFLVNATKRSAGLRVELEEVPGSPAKFQLVDGR
jgi:hypothetical protein